MVEANPILEQRVEALEQFSQARVIERVDELTEGVSSLESARTAENPYLASKTDIVRLESRHSATQKQIATQFEQVDKRFDAQAEQVDRQFKAQAELFDNKLQALSEQLRKEWEQRINRLVIWMILAFIAFSGMVLSLVAFFANRLPG